MTDGLHNYKTVLHQLQPSLQKELDAILSFWQREILKGEDGEIQGALDHDGTIHPDAPRGAVLYARILWTFSTAALLYPEKNLTGVATSVYRYFTSHFFDTAHGGVYWSTCSKGSPLETKKQVYAQGFAIYGLSAYYQLTGDKDALEQAIKLFRLLEEKCYDPVNDGYLEACNQQWDAITDLRLSEKDANEKKTMNTHLHVLEGYSLLYHIWPDAGLKHQIKQLLQVFRNHIIQPDTHTMGLFFDEQWKRKDLLISYGHDIEASWLLQEAAISIADNEWITWTAANAVQMAYASMKGIDKDGGMWHEWDGIRQQMVKEKHWWPQAEAMVGFFNAWQNSGKEIFLQTVQQTWNFISRHVIMPYPGEWKWGVYEDYSLMDTENMAGFWKCPYHNGRACMELIQRLKKYTTNE
jgi:cellobiose epimerase